jgi:hypothetical protein
MFRRSEAHLDRIISCSAAPMPACVPSLLFRSLAYEKEHVMRIGLVFAMGILVGAGVTTRSHRASACRGTTT